MGRLWCTVIVPDDRKATTRGWGAGMISERRKRTGHETKKRVYIPEEEQEDKEIDTGAGQWSKKDGSSSFGADQSF